MSASRLWRTVRGRFVLVILLGMGLPTTLLAPWIARSARESGEQVLRARLDESLLGAADVIGDRWIKQRSELLGVVEDPSVRALLQASTRVGGAGPLRSLDPTPQTWAELQPLAESITFHDADGIPRARLDRSDEGSGIALGASAMALVPVTLPIFDVASRTAIGHARAHLYLGTLMPPNVLLSGVGGAAVAIFDEEGVAVLAPSSMQPGNFKQDRFEWGAEHWLVARRRLYEPPMTLALAAPLAIVTEPFANTARSITFAMLVVLAVGVVVSVLVTARITSPLERLAGAADAVGRGDFDVPLEGGGPDEVQRVATAFGTMAGSLRALMQRLAQRESVAAVGEFASSLAHEIRNPLVSVRLDLERAQERLEDRARSQALIGRALRDIDRLDATVDGALRIARSGVLRLERLDLREPIAAAIASAEPRFSRAGARLLPPSASEPIEVLGNAAALEQLLLNLLLNAAEALPPGGSAAVSVAREGDATRLTVRDDGPGIPVELRSKVTEPFFTTKEGGTGLGLPIARGIALAHGSGLEIESTPGGGTSVSVALRAPTS